MKKQLCLLLLLVASCTSAPKQSEPDTHWQKTPDSFQASEAEDYNTILQLYQSQKYPQALVAIQRFENSNAKSRNTAEVQNLFGLIYLKNKKDKQSIFRFQKALSLSQDYRFKQYVLYNLAASQYESNRFGDASKTLSQIETRSAPSSIQYKVLYLQSLLDYREKNYLASLNHLLNASVLAQNIPENTQELFYKQAEKLVDKVKETQTLETAYQQHNESPLGDVLLVEIANRSFHGRELKKAEYHYDLLASRFPQSRFYNQAVEKLRILQSQKSNNPFTVGVLLPMTGKFSKFGKQSLNGIQLALRYFNWNEPESRVTLVIEDTGETKEQAIKAIEKLYFQHRVTAVIGPLVGEPLIEVSKRAESYGLPLLSLAQKSIERLSDDQLKYTFQISVTPKDQAYSIAQFAVQRKNFKKFAILFPEDEFGKEYAHLFWDAVEFYGGKIVGYEHYPADQTDFRTVVDKLSGLYYLEARQRELEELQQMRSRDHITKRTSRTEKYFKLPPIVDYDAVFIPDVTKTIGQVLPMFAYRDVDNIAFLGTATWNSPSLVKRARGFTQNTFFVDWFFADSESKKSNLFVKKYKETFHEAPNSIAALSFDAASLLENTLIGLSAGGNSISRDEIRNHLSQLKDFPGVTGFLTSENNQFKRNLKVLGIRNQSIVEILSSDVRGSETL